MGLEDIDITRLDEVIGRRRRTLRDERLYQMGEPIMSKEIIREQNVMLLLGSMRAEQRFAVFLTNLSSRYAARGPLPGTDLTSGVPARHSSAG